MTTLLTTQPLVARCYHWYWHCSLFCRPPPQPPLLLALARRPSCGLRSPYWLVWAESEGGQGGRDQGMEGTGRCGGSQVECTMAASAHTNHAVQTGVFRWKLVWHTPISLLRCLKIERTAPIAMSPSRNSTPTEEWCRASTCRPCRPRRSAFRRDCSDIAEPLIAYCGPHIQTSILARRFQHASTFASLLSNDVIMCRCRCRLIPSCVVVPLGPDERRGERGGLSAARVERREEGTGTQSVRK